MAASRGRALVVSCALDQFSYIQESHVHSLFTEVMLELLHQLGEIDLLSLYNKLHAEVKTRAAAIHKDQTPMLNSRDYERIVLINNHGRGS